MSKSIPILIVFALFVTGCVTTRAVVLDPTASQYGKVDPAQVRIFTSEDELAGYNYVKVAMITSKGNTTWTSRTQMIESMRKKAGDLGANAILLPQIAEPGTGAKIAGAVFGTGVNRQGEVIAYRIIGEK